MCPGPVTCLTTSPNGLYMLAGIAESIYLWEVSVRARIMGLSLWTLELDHQQCCHQHLVVWDGRPALPPVQTM